MEAVVLKPRTKSDMRFLLDLSKRMGISAQAIDTEELKDARFISLIKDGLKTPSISRKKIMEALKQ